MGYFKIKNITNLLPKRHIKANSTQKIDLSTNFNDNNVILSPDGEFILESNFLPFTLHKLRTEGLVTVSEISKDEYLSFTNTNNLTPPQVVENKVVVENIEKKTVITEKKKQSSEK